MFRKQFKISTLTTTDLIKRNKAEFSGAFRHYVEFINLKTLIMKLFICTKQKKLQIESFGTLTNI